MKDISHRLSTVCEQGGKLQTPVTFCELRHKGQPTTTGTRNTVTTLWMYDWVINPKETELSELNLYFPHVPKTPEENLCYRAVSVAIALSKSPTTGAKYSS